MPYEIRSVTLWHKDAHPAEGAWVEVLRDPNKALAVVAIAPALNAPMEKGWMLRYPSSFVDGRLIYTDVDISGFNWVDRGLYRGAFMNVWFLFDVDPSPGGALITRVEHKLTVQLLGPNGYETRDVDSENFLVFSNW